MGYCIHRIHSHFDEELICSICGDILEEPLQTPKCEHAFCQACIHEWLSRQPTCPVDRQPISISELKPVPRILKNLLGRLTISCDNADFGCTEILRLDALSTHLHVCEHNPKKLIACEAGCGMTIPKDELEQHNCIKELRLMITQQQEQIESLKSQVSDQRQTLLQQKHELTLFKECIRTIKPNQQRVFREIQTEIENDEIRRWSETIPVARVTRWGGMISTPDAVLQAVIKRALVESGCPSEIVQELMENAHERRWPPGLSTLETRQMNRHQYENYTTKRIPGKQAVLVMACDNAHMPDDMIKNPGIVMIFAHGVE